MEGAVFPASHYHVGDVSDWQQRRRCYILLTCRCLSLNYDDMRRSGRDGDVGGKLEKKEDGGEGECR